MYSFSKSTLKTYHEQEQRRHPEKSETIKIPTIYFKKNSSYLACRLICHSTYNPLDAFHPNFQLHFIQIPISFPFKAFKSVNL